MKATTVRIVLLPMCCLTMISCDSNKSKIEEKAKQLTEALKTKDGAIIDHTIVKNRVESEPDDDESFVIAGLVNKGYDINVKYQVS